MLLASTAFACGSSYLPEKHNNDEVKNEVSSNQNKERGCFAVFSIGVGMIEPKVLWGYDTRNSFVNQITKLSDEGMNHFYPVYINTKNIPKPINYTPVPNHAQP